MGNLIIVVAAAATRRDHSYFYLKCFKIPVRPLVFRKILDKLSNLSRYIIIIIFV